MSRHTEYLVIGVVAALLLFSPLYIRKVGDALIAVAGGDRVTLRQWGIDRAYYVGVGASLLMTASLSALALTAAVTIAFHLKPLSVETVLIGAGWFSAILSLDRWFVSDQKAGFAPTSAKKIGVGAQWVSHFVAELFKVSGRVVIGLLGAWLFGTFLLLMIFAPEVGQQMSAMFTQQVAKYHQEVNAQATQDASQAVSTLAQANAQIKKIQDDYNAGVTAIQQAQSSYSQGVNSLAAKGIECQYVTEEVRQYDATGHYHLVPQSYYFCPQPVQNLQTAEQAVLKKYPMTQQQEQDAIAAVQKQFGVPDLEKTIHDAPATAAAQLKGEVPVKQDGLLVRMQALDLLTSRPTGSCPAAPSVADLASNTACISRYSARAAEMQRNLIWWLIAIEISPVALKFVAAVLPRRGYAWAMAARDHAAIANAKAEMAAADAQMRGDIAKAVHVEHIRVEVEAAMLEKEIRKLAQEEQRWRVGRMRQLFSGMRRPALEPARAEIVDAEIVEPREAVPRTISRGERGHGPIDSEYFIY